MPIFEIVIVLLKPNDQSSIQVNQYTITYYVFVVTKMILRAYFAYLIYSYYTRLDRGETLLVEFGDRKLNKMIE